MINQEFKAQIQNLINFAHSQFAARTLLGNNKIKLDTKIEENTLWITFSTETQRHSITIPLPIVENGVVLISQNGVERPLCSHFFEKTQIKVDYIGAIHLILFDNPYGLIPNLPTKKIPFLQQIIYGFENGNAHIMVHNAQRAINELINQMPLHQTQLSSWVMNRRLLIVDSEFETLQNPTDRLNYQTNKAKKYFDKGWTSLGLSDGSLADKNYILATDIRKLTPFGIRYHNPGRNLFQTLKMKGDELPLIRSKSMQDLMDHKITRTGYNWFTTFVDIPDNFEDQIMMDKTLAGIPLIYKKRVQCFGDMLVKERDIVKYNQPLCTLPDGEVTRFNVVADKAVVKKIIETTVNVGNISTKVENVLIEYTRKLKEGFKVTNSHGNKGEVRFADLGYATNPVSGKRCKIDIMVSAKSIKKRRNYGQLLEALLNNINEDKDVVLPDNFIQPISEIHTGLEKRGFRKDGTWDCDTYAGKFKAVCGKVFWGVIESVEDTVWPRNKTTRRNGKGLRNAGLKFSHIEIRALETRFGVDNPLIDEIMTYAQGAENLHEQLCIMRSKIGELPANKPVIDIRNVKSVDQAGGTIVAPEMITDTIVDENYCKDGFILQLPITYQVLIDGKGQVVYEGPPQYVNPQANEYSEVIYTDKIYIPNGMERSCWRHPTGRYGLNEIGVLINNIAVLCHRYIVNPQNSINFMLVHRAIYNYFNKVTAMMSTKRGDISVYGMAVRYPLSAKGRATLSNSLPKNVVEIHRSIANGIYVKSGDVVIVERFPCLGFMSVRPQKIRVTDDPQCRYVIRASKNCLGSLSLDFDGDVLFIASFHSKASKAMLRNEHNNPNKTCYSAIQALNKKAGVPHIKSMTLYDYEITPFDLLDNETHSRHVGNLTGVKAQTGPIIALTYNIMRLAENSNLKKSRKLDVGIELFLDKVANSVFSQKHGTKSLHEVVLKALCVGDVEAMVKEGFDRNTTFTICSTIREKALALGVPSLIEYYEKTNGKGSNIISKIVKEENLIYYASRAKLECTELLNALKAPTVDVPSRLLKWIMSGKTSIKKTQLEYLHDEKALLKMKDTKYRSAASTVLKIVENVLTPVNKSKAFSKTIQKYRITNTKLNVCKRGIYVKSTER